MELMKKDIVFPDVPHNGVLGGNMYDMRGNRIFTEIGRTSWKTLWEVTCDEWRRTVDEYEATPGDFYAAWQYLEHHPAFWAFRHGPADPKPYPPKRFSRVRRLVHGSDDTEPYPLERRLHVRNLINEDGIRRCVDIMVVKVNAETRSTEDGEPLETEVWIELGQQSWPQEINLKDPNTFDAKFHDYLLDCGGPTVEAAILRAAHNVWEVYGNDRRICDGAYNKMAYITVVDDEYFTELMLENGDDGEINDKVRRASERLHEVLEQATGDGKPRRKKAGR